MDPMTQEAPFPKPLASLVEKVTYRDGWDFRLVDMDRGQGSKGLTLSIVGTYPDTHHPERLIRVQHLFPVVPAAYNEQSWRRWLFERVLEVERHESAEFFRIDGVQPYAPQHGPGNDPYIIFEQGDDVERRTSFRGEVKAP